MTLWLRNGRGLVAGLALAMVGTGMAAAQGDKPVQAAKGDGYWECPSISRYELPERLFVLHNAAAATDGNEILTALRLMLDPQTKLYLIPSRSEIMLRGCPVELELGAKLIAELDKPQQNFKLTFTLTETDAAGKRLGVQHVSMTAQNGQHILLKNGSKVPIITGSVNPTVKDDQQVTYLDFGLSFDVTASSSSAAGDAIALKAKVEQSTIAEDKSALVPQDPVVRQSVIEGTTVVTPGKAQMLGSFDVSGSTRHIEVEVVVEVVK